MTKTVEKNNLEEREFIITIVNLAIKKAGSAKELADFLGVAKARISEYHSGKVTMNAVTFIKLIQYLEMSIMHKKGKIYG